MDDGLPERVPVVHEEPFDFTAMVVGDVLHVSEERTSVPCGSYWRIIEIEAGRPLVRHQGYEDPGCTVPFVPLQERIRKLRAQAATPAGPASGTWLDYGMPW